MVKYFKQFCFLSIFFSLRRSLGIKAESWGGGNILPLLLFFLLILNLPIYNKTIPAAEKPLNLYKRKIYTSRDGLPTNSVFDIVQTPDGFIWMATDAGITRFDGVDFEVPPKEIIMEEKS
ncbi:MAG: hypothetical protein KAW12_09860 [Candidatus Aminicenantes bacterium]|nr:hypothetical protein [Candidatus Aminicenantes bacterium]